MDLSLVFIQWKSDGRPPSLTGRDSLLQYDNHFMDEFLYYIYKIISGGSCFIDRQNFQLSYSFRPNICNGAPCGMRPPALFQSSACEAAGSCYWQRVVLSYAVFLIVQLS
ncbi:hypothetical protein OIU76_006123 [Salix suchowensis]|nr:hypothetical protein OIU78_016006 [Salix suchowensis]KAJ6344535.1 hypothetical protein OIU76_006123 [Salix suchowensis]